MGITTTKEEFETQSEYLKGRRIEENNKLRSIIRERVASSKDSESIFRSLYNKIPTNVRLLVENLTGVDRPITAADFTEDELVEMIFLAEKTKQANKKREEVVQDVLTDKAYTPDAETKEYSFNFFLITLGLIFLLPTTSPNTYFIASNTLA